MLFAPNNKVIFIGDSITDAGRSDPSTPNGTGYVSMIHDLLLARYPELNLTILNKGISGNTVRDLDQRWEQDVVAEKPDWLSVMIGINDVWRHFDGQPAQAVPIDEFGTTLRRLLKRAQDATSAQLLLAEPYMIEKDQSNSMRQLMDLYSQTVDQMAGEFGAVLVKTQAAFDNALTKTDDSFWADDKIHPNGPGHAVIAIAFLQVLLFSL